MSDILLYDLTFEVAPLPMFWLDQALEVLGANPAACRLFKAPSEALVGRFFGELVVVDEGGHLPLPADSAWFGPRHVGVGAGADVAPFKAELVMNLKDIDGVPYVHVTVLERAERALIQAAQQQRELRFKSLYNQTPLLVFSINDAHELMDVNQRWSDALGWERAECLGQPWMAFLDDGSKVMARAAFERLFEDRADIHEIELRFCSRNGECFDTLLSMGLLEGYEVPEGLAFGVDITERKLAAMELRKARNEAEAANRAKNIFLANMSHELRTPLNGILGYAQVLKRSVLTEPQRRGVDIIHKSGEHLLTLIDDVLDLSRIEAQRMELVPEALELPGLLTTVADLIKVRARQKGLTFKTGFAPDLPEVVEGDSSKLRQVLMNLLVNAVKFTEQGSVTFSASLIDSQRLRFEIADTGIGIPKVQQEAIFKPFHQVEDASPSHVGTGLGLAISRKLVGLMNGQLSVTSVQGQGATFVFEVALPIITGHGALKDRAVFAPVGYEGPRRTIVVADDHWQNRAFLVQILKPLGFEVLEAADGVEAVALAHRQPQPAAILMDLVMPNLDGFEAARKLRQTPQTKGMVIIALSASVFDGDRHQSISAGCDRFLKKPVRVEALLMALGEELGLRWVEQEAAADEEGDGQAVDGECDGTARPPEFEPGELEHIYEAARQGRILKVRQELVRLRQAYGKSHGQFIERLERCASEFKTEALCALVDAHRANA